MKSLASFEADLNLDRSTRLEELSTIGTIFKVNLKPNYAWCPEDFVGLPQ
jgi:hypothetical protein